MKHFLFVACHTYLTSHLHYYGLWTTSIVAIFSSLFSLFSFFVVVVVIYFILSHYISPLTTIDKHFICHNMKGMEGKR